MYVHCTEGWVGPSASLGYTESKNNLLFLPKQTPDCPACSVVIPTTLAEIHTTPYTNHTYKNLKLYFWSMKMEPKTEFRWGCFLLP
jgi:hypothetical protein